jgi:hypothetical protein
MAAASSAVPHSSLNSPRAPSNPTPLPSKSLLPKATPSPSISTYPAFANSLVTPGTRHLRRPLFYACFTTNHFRTRSSLALRGPVFSTTSAAIRMVTNILLDTRCIFMLYSRMFAAQYTLPHLPLLCDLRALCVKKYLQPRPCPSTRGTQSRRPSSSLFSLFPQKHENLNLIRSTSSALSQKECFPNSLSINHLRTLLQNTGVPPLPLGIPPILFPLFPQRVNM